MILPKDYDKKKTYPALFVFPPGAGTRGADWLIGNVLGEQAQDLGWIVVVATPPKGGWWTHPTHHALEGLMKKVRKKHSIEDNNYHLAGFGNDGCRAALTYSGMSLKYFKSLSITHASAWSNWSDEEIKQGFREDGYRLHLFESSKSEYARKQNARVKKACDDAGIPCSVEVLRDDAGSLPSLHHGSWLVRIAKSLRAKPKE